MLRRARAVARELVALAGEIARGAFWITFIALACLGWYVVGCLVLELPVRLPW